MNSKNTNNLIKASALMSITKIVTNDSSSSSEDEWDKNSVSSVSSLDSVILFSKQRKKHHYVKEYVEKVVSHYDDIDFQSHFRFTRSVVEQVCKEMKVRPMIVTPGRPPVQPIEALLLTLWVLANQECFRSTADRFGFSRGHAHNIFIRIVKIISSNRRKYIKWPTDDELFQNVQQFNVLRGERSFPNVVGCVDGTHIPIPGPANDNSFFNRKSFNSIIVQGICKAAMTFINVYCGWPGSVHDSRVWRNSPIYEQLNNNILPDNYHLLGDTAYPLNNYLMVPFKDNGHLTARQKKFNKTLSSTRVIIEQAYGRLKGTWRRLKYFNITNLVYFKYIVITACIFHNICIREKIPLDTDDEEFGNEDDEAFEGHAPVAAQTKRNMIVNML